MSMQRLLENWRTFKKVLTEDTETRYGENYSELRKLIDDASHRTWIFFDTETTGLGAEKRYNQITQIAAIAVEPNGFKEGAEPKIVGKINVRMNLVDDAKGFIKWQAKKTAEEGGSNGRPTVPDIFKMTGYGLKRNPYKRQKKEMAKHGSSYADTPIDKSKKFHRMNSGMQQFVDFLDQFDSRVIVAQNAPFDVGYVNEMFKRVGKPAPDDLVVDTVQIFKKYITPLVKKMKEKKERGEQLSPSDHHILKSLTKVNKTGKEMLTVSLGNLIGAFNVENSGWHDAENDVFMLMRVLKNVLIYLDKQQEQGQIKGFEQDPQLALDLDKPSDIPLQESDDYEDDDEDEYKATQEGFDCGRSDRDNQEPKNRKRAWEKSKSKTHGEHLRKSFFEGYEDGAGWN